MVSFMCHCYIADSEILEVFMTSNDFPTELVSDKPLSIVIMGGPCSSRVAVANRLLGLNVLPSPQCNVAWHTLQFIDSELVSSFNTADVNTIWSWVDSIPLVSVEIDSEHHTVDKAEVLSMMCGNFKSEYMRTAPVVNILMSHPLLRAGTQVVVCGDHSDISTVQFAVTGVIPVIIFVVSGDQLLDKVRDAASCQFCYLLILYDN